MSELERRLQLERVQAEHSVQLLIRSIHEKTVSMGEQLEESLQVFTEKEQASVAQTELNMKLLEQTKATSVKLKTQHYENEVALRDLRGDILAKQNEDDEVKKLVDVAIKRESDLKAQIEKARLDAEEKGKKVAVELSEAQEELIRANKILKTKKSEETNLAFSNATLEDELKKKSHMARTARAEHKSKIKSLHSKVATLDEQAKASKAILADVQSKIDTLSKGHKEAEGVLQTQLDCEETFKASIEDKKRLLTKTKDNKSKHEAEGFELDSRLEVANAEASAKLQEFEGLTASLQADCVGLDASIMAKKEASTMSSREIESATQQLDDIKVNYCEAAPYSL